MPRITLTLRAPNLPQRLWYRRLGMTLPKAVAESGPRSAKWVRLLPYTWRRIHHTYATTHRYYWLPCPLCGREHGGHESGDTIPNPLKGEGCGISICSQCTIARNRGDRRDSS